MSTQALRNGLACGGMVDWVQLSVLRTDRYVRAKASFVLTQRVQVLPQQDRLPTQPACMCG